MAASKPIVINRAPVLQLWAASVAQFLHDDDDISWTTSLSVGSAIATLCAISKGRSIGKMEPADPDKQVGDKNHRGKRQKTESAADQELKVMGFPMHVKNGQVTVQGKPKTANEDALKAKFGDQAYHLVKDAMHDALEAWKGREADLDKSAFGMYEHFRPSVQSGQRGWGRKGELTVESIKDAVRTK